MSTQPTPWLERVTFNLFPGVMGLAALGHAWRVAGRDHGLPPWIGEALLALAGATFALFLFAHLLRLLRAPHRALAEIRDPVTANFVSALAIAGGLIAMALAPYSPGAALALWVPAAALEYGWLLAMMRRWILHPQNPDLILPVWLLPMVGNSVMCFAGAALGFVDLSWMLLAAALVTWAGFLPLFLQRAISAPQKIPAPLAPSLAILASAPAICALGLNTLTGAVDAGFRLLAYAGLFFALVTLALGRATIASGFNRGWWAFSFSSGAIANAMLRLHHVTHSAFSGALAFGMLAIATLVTGWVALSGARALARDLARQRPQTA